MEGTWRIVNEAFISLALPGTTIRERLATFEHTDPNQSCFSLMTRYKISFTYSAWRHVYGKETRLLRPICVALIPEELNLTQS